MIGSTLTRYSNETFLCFDFESFKPSLNLGFALPWQLAYAVATLKGVHQTKSHLIRWPNMVIEPDNPSFAHFNRAEYEAKARDPREVWEEFGPLLRKHRSVGHNLIGFDAYVVKNWQVALGLKPSYDWLYEPGLADTNCISKAYRAGWVPNTSSPEAFLAWQYAAYHTRLPKPPKGQAPKTKLGVMCGEFKIEYDPAKAHDALYDIERNVLLLKELAWKVEF